MPDENWDLTDGVSATEAYRLSGSRSYSEALDAADGFTWHPAWPLADNGAVADTLVTGILLTDSVSATEAYRLSGSRSYNETLEAAEGSAWSADWPVTENVYAAEAFAVFERVIWKLTLGRW